MKNFDVGNVNIDVFEDSRSVNAVPPSQWHGDRQERMADAILANLRADDGLRAQVSLLRWPENNEVSLGYAEIFGGPSDYGRLEDAGAMSPKLAGTKLVARIRALRYGDAGRATGSVVDWAQIDEWAAGNAQELLRQLGATRTGDYGVLFPEATRFKSEPAVEAPLGDPRALFAVYALTRVIPIMTGYGKQQVESPNS